MLESLKKNKSLWEVVKKLKTKIFVSLVQKAYRSRMSPAHKLIRAVGKSWYGITKSGPVKKKASHWIMDNVLIAQKSIFESNHKIMDLGLEEIGVHQLKIHCTSENINSSIVYLMGFCDNLHHFKIYDIFVSPGTVAIDVGANLGIHSLVLSRCVGEYGKVFLFEPVNKLIKALKKNFAVNKVNNAVIIGKGAGESIGQQPFTFIEKEFNIGKGRVDYESKVFCKFSTIDFELKSNNQKISLIKIDTEGYELNVLKGAIKSISDSRPVLVIEFNPGYYSFEELKQYVPNNYSFYRIPEFNYLKITRIKDDEIDTGDILIIPTEKITPEYLSQLSN